MTMSKRDKRKSEVLIAAQSLDQEVQHVKNLKRLSIGSMDLLMDPEMEYRVSTRQSSPTSVNSQEIKRRSTSGTSTDSDISPVSQDSILETPVTQEGTPDETFTSGEDTTIGGTADEEDDTYSFTDDSMDVTNAEYLDQDAQANLTNSTYQQEPLPKRRVLSGSVAGQLRSRSTSGSSDGKEELKHSESLSQNLLWVRADQHPNVKPENYLELVQNTLENLNLDDHTAVNDVQAHSLSDLKILRRRSLQSQNSLARRPSRLRKSYTEISEDVDGTQQTEDNAKQLLLPVSVPSLKETRRTMSLKDITEELTKLSNQAGLTDTDAVTLARTLRVADNISDEENEQNKNPGPQQEEDDSEYASTMLIKNRFTLPARHSLRRSKFNTYRIQSFDSNEEIENGALGMNHRSPSGTNSPNSIIGMYNDEPYYEKKPIVQEFFSTLPANDDLESDTSTEEADSSTDFSNELSAELETANTSQRVMSERSDNTTKWKWSQNTTTAVDFQQAQSVPKDNLSPYKINHSRNRHNVPSSSTGLNTSETSIHSGNSTLSSSSSTLSLGTSKVSVPEVETKNVPLSHIGPQKQHLDKPLPAIEDKKVKKSGQSQNKFIKFFKKRTSSSESKMLKELNSNLNHDTQVRELKQKQSGNGLSTKFKISPKKSSKTELSKFEQIKHKGKVIIEFDRDKKESKRKASLQPAVTVTKANDEVKLQKEPRGQLGTIIYEDNVNNMGDGNVHGNAASKTKSHDNYDDEVEVSEFSVQEDSFTSLNSGQSNISLSKEPMLTSMEQNSPNSNESIHSSPTSPASASASPPVPLQTNAQTQEELRLEQEQLPTLPDNNYPLPPRKLTFDDVVKPDRPNAPMKFTDSAFGFPLPPLTISTVIMFDHRLPIHVERAIYRLSHLKLSDPKRVLRQQVLLSNFMYAYLNLVNHSLYLQQLEEERMGGQGSSQLGSGNPLIDIPDI